jgi:hypothetical protein
VLHFLRATRSETPMLLCAQCVSPFGTIGLPVAINRFGVTPRPDLLSDDERQTLQQVGAEVSEKLRRLRESVTR